MMFVSPTARVWSEKFKIPKQYIATPFRFSDFSDSPNTNAMHSEYKNNGAGTAVAICFVFVTYYVCILGNLQHHKIWLGTFLVYLLRFCIFRTAPSPSGPTNITTYSAPPS
jgi:hypothetical protein